MFGTPLDGKIAREDFEKYAEDVRDGLKCLNPAEAENVYSAVVSISDMLGLDKYAKDGGMSYSAREFENLRSYVASLPKGICLRQFVCSTQPTLRHWTPSVGIASWRGASG